MWGLRSIQLSCLISDKLDSNKSRKCFTKSRQNEMSLEFFQNYGIRVYWMVG